jgi:hypothetical protein
VVDARGGGLLDEARRRGSRLTTTLQRRADRQHDGERKERAADDPEDQPQRV